jgi:hypothetical protein
LSGCRLRRSHFIWSKGSKAGPISFEYSCRGLMERQMADNKNPNEKQPGEKPEGKNHYNPGNQSGKDAKLVPKEDAKKDD